MLPYLQNPSWIDFHKNKFELKVIKVLQRLLLIHQYLKSNFDSIKAHMWFASEVFHQIHLLKKKNLLCLKKLSVLPLNFCAEMRREEVVLKSSREAQSYTSHVLYMYRYKHLKITAFGQPFGQNKTGLVFCRLAYTSSEP